MSHEAIPAVVIGAGQAGLAVSYELERAGIEHVILDRARVAQAWRDRWDSFSLVTPNWTFKLPGAEFAEDDPEGFLLRDEIVGRLDRYARALSAPIREGIEVTSLEARPEGGGFSLQTSNGRIEAKDVVLATGAFQEPFLPPGAEALPAEVHVIHSADYRSPDALPSGPVLIIGSGQTGCQIAEELAEDGRHVILSCGRAPWVPRRIEGRDIITWLGETSFFEQSLDDLPSPAARLLSNPQASGRDGGHDLHFRTLAALGVTLAGRFQGVSDHSAEFAPDLPELLAFSDARYADVCELIRVACAQRGSPIPEFPPAEPFSPQAPDRIDLRGCGTAIFASGFRPAYSSWVRFASAFDDLGFPVQTDGASTVVPGLYFMGIHFQRKRKSGIFLGVGEDAAVVAERIASA